jgi:hypothetical protein
MLSMSNSLLRLAKLSAVNVMLLSYQEPGPFMSRRSGTRISPGKIDIGVQARCKFSALAS